MSAPVPPHLHLLAELPPELTQRWHEAQDAVARARALLRITHFLKDISKWKAIEAAWWALEQAQLTQDEKLMIKARLTLSSVLTQAGRATEALQQVQQALVQAEALPDESRAYVLEVVGVRAVVRGSVGDEARAWRDCLYVLHHAQEALDRIPLLLGHVNLAWLYIDSEQPEAALHHVGLAASVLEEIARQSLNEGRSFSDENYFRFAVLDTQLLALCLLARQLEARGRKQALRATLQKAWDLLQAAVPLVEEGQLHSHLLLAVHRSTLYRLQGDLQQAGQQAQDAVRLARQIGQNLYSTPHLVMAEWQVASEQWPEAILSYQEALAIARHSGQPHSIQSLLTDLAAVYERIGELPRALEVTREALKHAREVNRVLGEVQAIEDRIPTSLDSSTTVVEGFTWQERLRLAEAEARLDPLTGLLNRRGLEYELQPFIQAAPHPEPLLVALLDLEATQAAHEGVSDEVLCRAAQLLNDALPNEASLARYGGEEFVLAWHIPSMPLALSLLERCQQTIEQYQWAELLSDGTVQLSIGYTFGSAQQLAEAMQQADEALAAVQAQAPGPARIKGAHEVGALS